MNSISSVIFQHPFTCMVAGPSQSGKSTLLARILDQNKMLINPQPSRIIYCYARWTNAFEKLKMINPSIEFKEGLPSLDELNSLDNNLLILDDLMASAEKDPSILDLFTTDSHHSSISVFLITQNLFSQGKYARTISLNCQYMLILNNPRDSAQIYNLSRQMFPTNSSYLIECYQDATSQKYGYLFLDLKQETENKYRVQSGVTIGETRVIYVQK